jgi:Trypsin-like peptidase domain
VVAVDGYLDIAVIKIARGLSGAPVAKADLSDLTQITLGNSDHLRSGDAITAIGYPAAADSDAPTLTRGVVAGTVADNRLATTRAQINITAVTSPGSSGGLAADSKGRLVATTTWGLPDAQGQTAYASTRPINLAKPVIAAAERGAAYSSPWVTPAPAGSSVQAASLHAVASGDPGTITGSCAGAGAANPLTFAFNYSGFPAGKNVDVYAALYEQVAGEDGQQSAGVPARVAAASSWLGSQFPNSLPASGCATLTLQPLISTAIPQGIYTLKIAVGGDLKTVFNAPVPAG